MSTDYPKYPYLEHLIEKRGIKLKRIRDIWGISQSSFNNKLYGTGTISFDEAKALREHIFPDVSIYALMSQDHDFMTEEERISRITYKTGGGYEQD